MADIGIFLADQNMCGQAEKVIREDGRKIQVIKGAYGETAAKVREAEKNGVRVLVSRGLQAEKIREHTSACVVEIPFSAKELGSAVLGLKQRLRRERPVIALIGSAGMFRNAAGLEELFGFQMRRYELAGPDQAGAALRRAAAEGADAAAGEELPAGRGVESEEEETMETLAGREGLPWSKIELTEESLRSALDEAERMGAALDRERSRSAQLTAILDLSFNGVVRLNERLEIVAVNRVIETLLGRKASEIVGMPVEKVMRGIDRDSMEENLAKGQEMFVDSVNVNGALLLVAGAPLRLEGELNGAVLICRRLRSEDGAEARKREDGGGNVYGASGNFSQITRKSLAMRSCMQTARLYACSRNPILLCGETGTEVELMAECIHNNSVQRNGPFLNVNCGAIPQEEQETVLFGEFDLRRGEWVSEGVLGAGVCGTVLLQEVEKLSPGNQYLLFKAVSRQMYWNHESMVRRNGAARVIATIRRELEPLVRQGKFRQDLYYMLHAMEIRIPPLREDRREISRLAREYVCGYLERYSKYLEVDEEAYEEMEGYPWEGNLLQLDRFCERLVLGTKRRRVDREFMKNLLSEMYPQPENFEGSDGGLRWKEPEAEAIVRMLDEWGGNRAKAAESLGISVTTLWRRMKKYGISEKYGV